MITVKGVEVRAEEVSIETEFRFLTEEGQKRLFLENKEVFLLDALSSDYPAVCRLLWEPEVLKSCSADLLNQAIGFCCMATEVGDVMTLINAVGSELSKNNMEFIACASWTDVELKVLVAKNGETSLQILKNGAMFIAAASKFVDGNDTRLFDAIVTNPNFEVDEEIEETIQAFASKRAAKIRARIEQLRK